MNLIDIVAPRQWLVVAVVWSCAALADEEPQGSDNRYGPVQLGPRPEFLINDMRPGPLQEELLGCIAREPRRTAFSIGHRGAPLQFPEHTRESYVAAFRMGAGRIECDVTFTKDEALVCRHSQNDLATTTNILMTPLASTCVVPFRPAVIDDDGNVVEPATAECRTSEITLAEFKSLRGKMDAFDPSAQTPAEFVAGQSSVRTSLYAGPSSGELLTHAESIELFTELGVDMIPELKAPSVPMPFGEFSREDYAQKLIDEYVSAGVATEDVWVQSFDIADIRYWLKHAPEFARQAVLLDDAGAPDELPSRAELMSYKAEGINVVAPPMFALLTVRDDRIVPSQYALDAKAAGLDVLAWTFERSGILADGDNGFYYQTIDSAISREGDAFVVLDVLARQAGIRGMFSDWAAPVTFYATCTDLE